MAKRVPWADGPNWERCGAPVTLWWAGQYEAACIEPAGHSADVDHGDRIGRPVKDDDAGVTAST